MSTRPTSKLALALSCAALVALGGCATTRPSDAMVYRSDAYAEPVLEAPAEAPLPPGEDPTAATEDTEASDAAPASDMPASRPGSGKFINEKVAARAPAGAGATGEVTFNFEGESLHAVVKAILGDFLQQNYVIAPGVQGNVTFSTAKPLRGDQALSILEMLLRWNNATLVWQDGRYTILPVAQALPGNLTPRVGPAASARGYEVRAVPLQYISALEMEKLLKPYAKPEGVINVDAARNMIVLAGTRAELENYLQTIEVFDVDWLAGMSVGVFPLQQAEAAKTVTDLEKIFGEGSNTPLAGMFRFMPLEGINAVMVITPQPKYLATVEEWLERLDMGGGEAGQRLYVYDVKNVKAADLAATLGDIFGGGSGGGARSAPPSGDRLMPGLEPVEIRTVGTSGNVSPSSGAEPKQEVATADARNADRGGQGGPDGAAASGPVVDTAGGIALGASDEVRISASEENNALLIKATSGQWESIRRVIERLDTIPLQVHIEAQIVRVALNDSLNFGVRWFFENNITGNGVPPRASALGRSGWGDFGGSFGQGIGINWSFIGPDAAAVIQTLDSVTETTVISAPSLVVLNNKSANINVGTQLPVVSSFIGSGGFQDPNNPNTGLNQSYVQFRQTGITLNVTPRVNPGGLVFMEIEQEESTPGAQADAIGGNVPVDNRSIQTEVAVQSGQTVLLGGLIRENNGKGRSGVPFLSRVPVLGALFGTQNKTSEREELLVLITPRVISNGDEARRMTDEYTRRFRGIEPLRVRVEK